MYTLEILICDTETGVPNSGYNPSLPTHTAPTGGGQPVDGGSSGTGTNPNPVEGAQGQLGGTPTLPILGGNPKDDSPCGQLKKVSENTNVKAKFTTLKNNIDGTKEKGFLIRDIAGNETSDILEGNARGEIQYPYNTSDPIIIKSIQIIVSFHLWEDGNT